ncbi:MAG: hypothetical protein AB1486_24675 [Planctomycetota bacterium]
MKAQDATIEQGSTLKPRGARWVSAFLIVGLAATLPYLASRNGDFIYDDIPYIVNSQRQVRGPDLSPVFTEALPPERPELGLYRPLTVLTYRLQAPGGLLSQASAFRTANIALHALCAALVVVAASALGLSLAAATMAGALFATHPALVESVAWTVGRAELLAALFGLLAFVIHGRVRRTGIRYPALALALLAACASKENALAFPAVLLAFTVARAGESRHTIPWLELLTYTLVLSGTLILRLAVLGRLAPDPQGATLHPATLGERLFLVLDLLACYLRFEVWPYPSRIFHHASEFGTPNASDALVIIVYVFLLWQTWRRRRLASACLAWVALSLVPVLNLVPIQETFAERFLYFPTVGACLAAGFGIEAWMRAEQRRSKLLALAVLIPGMAILAGAALTSARASQFRSSIVLWEEESRRAPALPYPHYNLGLAYEEAAAYEPFGGPQRKAALRAHQESLRLDPRHRHAAYAHLQLAQLSTGMGLPRDAASHYRQAIELGRLPETIMEPRYLLSAHLGLAHCHTIAPETVGSDEARRALLAALPLAEEPEERARIAESLQELEKNR